MLKMFYFKQFNLKSTLLIRLETAKLFQLLLCVSNNSISHLFTQS